MFYLMLQERLPIEVIHDINTKSKQFFIGFFNPGLTIQQVLLAKAEN